MNKILRRPCQEEHGKAEGGQNQVARPRGPEILEKVKQHQGKPGDCEEVGDQAVEGQKITGKEERGGACEAAGRACPEVSQECIGREGREEIVEYDEPVPCHVERQKQVE